VAQLVQYRPTDKFKRHPENPRLGDVEAIKESIRANGWHGTVVIQASTGFIVAGNHRTDAALELARGDFNPYPDQPTEEFEREKVKWAQKYPEGVATLPTFVADIDDDTARRILLADNRTSDLATYDDPALLRLTAQIVDPETAIAIMADPDSSPDDKTEALRLLAKEKARAPGRLRGTGYKSQDVEQLALAMEGGQAAEWGSAGVGQFQRTEVFETSQVRQIVFALKVEEFEKVMPVLLKIVDDQGFETNTDAFLWLVEQYAPKEEEAAS
jgi:hypothetical protein